MTNPIERAAEYLSEHWPAGVLLSNDQIAKLVFESIDVEELARALHASECAPNCPRDVGDTDKRYARAMKAHLTGGSHD